MDKEDTFLGAFCMFFPSLVSCFLWDRFGRKNDKDDICISVKTYIVHWLIIQAAVMLLLKVWGHNFQTPIYVLLNRSFRFAIRYLAASLTLAGVLPPVEFWLKKRLPMIHGGGAHPHRGKLPAGCCGQWQDLAL